MNILYLSLKSEWYWMISSGAKTEEYREITDYWTKRLEGKIYDAVQFSLGYPKRDDASRRMMFRLDRIEKRTGNPLWGAIPDKEYYVLVLGEKIEII